MFVYSHQIYADTAVTYLEKDKPAPYTGYLFTPSKEKELRLLDSETTYYKALTNSLQIINKAQEDNLNKYNERIELRDKRIDTLETQENYQWLKTMGAFALGCLITTTLVFGVGNSLK